MANPQAPLSLLDQPQARRAAIRSVRAVPARQAMGTMAKEPRVGSPLALRVPGRGVVITTPIVRMLGVVGAAERYFQTRRGNVYELWVEPE